MKVLDRYIGGQFIRSFVMIVLGLPLLFVITDLTDNLDKYVDRGLGGQAVALSYVYQLPLFIFYSFPIAALVATVFTIGRMTSHMEVSAAKAAGVSFYRLITPIVVIGAGLSLVSLGLGELVPVTIREKAELLGEKRIHLSSLRTNFVFQTERNGVLTIRRLDPTVREMNDVVLERRATPTSPGVHGTAQTARWDPERGWRFEEGYLRVLAPGQGERAFAFTSMRLPELRETPEELLAEPQDPETMRYEEMGRFIRAIERSGGNAGELVVERALKISLPLAVFVIILFGAPLSTTSRRGGAAFGIGVSLIVTLVYLMLFRVGKALGSSGALDPLLAAWLPNGIFLLAALVLLARVRT